MTRQSRQPVDARAGKEPGGPEPGPEPSASASSFAVDYDGRRGS
jgi:hypothetical protein